MGGLVAFAVSVLFFLGGSDAQLFGAKTDNLMSAFLIPCPVEKAMPKFDLSKVKYISVILIIVCTNFNLKSSILIRNVFFK